jgi:hypothetical protein
VQYAVRDFERGTLEDQDYLQAGLAWWLQGHNRNLKIGIGRLHADRRPDRLQVQIQLQVLYY